MLKIVKNSFYSLNGYTFVFGDHKPVIDAQFFLIFATADTLYFLFTMHNGNGIVG